MRHRKSFNHLGRTNTSRKAMFSNMASSLILHKRITTTLAKAKALRSYVEPLITKSKEDTTHSRRVAFSYLQDKFAVTELFREVSAKVADRPGGYTRVIKLGTRSGDNAEMAMIELVDYNELMLTDKEAKKAKSTRRRRGSKKSTTDQATTPASEVTEEKVEAKTEETPKEEAKAEAKKEEKVEEKPVEAKKEVEEVKEVKVEEVKEEKVKEEKVEEKTASVEPKKEEPKKEEKKEDAEEKKA
ncbi:MAG: 50S ribosomal protein L17 [Bacteroidetes bacterium]|nr:50S ribosomal protein L17 [Bacteroidota bacterium]